MKTADEFLEELRKYCDQKSNEKEPCYMCDSRSKSYEDVVEIIEQFQAQQKDNSDENSR